MNIKKYVISTGLVAAALSGTLYLASAYAEDQPGAMVEKKDRSAIMEKKFYPQPMIVQIGHEGRTLLRGTVATAGTNSLTVKSWGGDWVVNVSSSTKLTSGSDMTQFQTGDFVGVQGSINQSAAWTIDATLVRNWTDRKESQMMKKEIKEMMKAQSPKNWEGVASNVNASVRTLTLTVDGIAYNVNIVTTAKVVNKMYLAIDLQAIKDGDTVRVWGPSADTVITAYVVRDVSLGVGTTTFPDIVTCCTESRTCTRVDRPQCASAEGTVNSASSCSPNPC